MSRKLSKAPVYYVIAAVSFNPILKMDNYVAAIQDHFRKNGFPDLSQNVFNVLDVNLNGQPPGQATFAQRPVAQYLFLNENRTACFTLAHDRLTYQTTEYEKFDSFSTVFLDGLSFVSQTIGLAYFERIGIRYLDAIVVPENEPIQNYLNPAILGIVDESIGRRTISFSESVFDDGQVQVTARSISMKGPLGMPADLQPMQLKLLPRFTEINGAHTILDTDGSAPQGWRVPKIDKIKEKLISIHDKISLAFTTTVTKQALEIWK